MEKIARICWNTHDWKRPSGSEGKSLSDGSYEKKIGFGHEEWILDDSRIYGPNGYHYGFLQPMNVASGKHIGAVYDIHLFSISPLKQKVYVGCLHHAVGVSPEESKMVYQYYKERGWIEEMKDEIRFAGGTVRDIKPKWFFNVKFKFSEATLNYSNKPILASDSVPGHRYNLMDKKNDFVFESDEEGKVKVLDTSCFIKTTEKGEVLIDPLHKKIQNAVAKLIKKDYVHPYVETGLSDAEGQRVDIKGIFKETGEWHYFEIKTDSAKKSIREALGQILEYAHYPNMQRATKLFIVGPQQPDDKDTAYMEFIRKTYGIPVWFRWYSFEQNKLYDGI